MWDSLLLYCLVGLIALSVSCGRYLVMTGAYYVVVCKLFDRRFRSCKIHPDPFPAEAMRSEMTWALLNNVNYAILAILTYRLYERGYLKLYFDWQERGTLYGILIIPGLLIAHDAYFFWVHYLMHRKQFWFVSHHHVHHQFHNVSPWAAFAVHPIEGFIELLFRPILLMLIPTHPFTLIAFAIVSFALNIIGHSGYELFPKSFATSPLTKYSSCATYHYLHHRNSRYNFGLFFNIWDRVLGTMDPEYPAFYATMHGTAGSGERTAAYDANSSAS